MNINYNHGGPRVGAGRKKNTGKFKEKTQVMRIPISLVNNVGQALKEYKKEIDKFSVPTPNAPDVIIPFFSSRVQAGFPSPADDHLEDSLDLNKYLIHHEESTFFVRAQGDSMLGAGIYPGDILVVDKSLDAKNGKIVIAVVDGEFTVKRLQRHQNKITLKSENPNYKDIDIKKENELTIWGVVTSVIHKYL